MTDRPDAGVIMVQGTSSHAGKSVLATALCRIFAQDGFMAAPFKAQNMSLNSYVTPDGSEIGRSQAVQAQAARAVPRVEMNPVLLKPEGGGRSQVILMGRPVAVTSPQQYYELRPGIWDAAAAALGRLRAEYDVVVMEGAGSPAEINLKEQDIANMRVALHADSPVLLVGDIDRGGVFAQFVGTMALLDPAERRLVRGYVINKFRGDQSLLTPGLEYLHRTTGVPVAGVLPYFSDIHIPEEDSLGLDPGASGGAEAVLDIAVMRLPHLANFDDFDPLAREPSVSLRYVGSADEFGQPDLVIIPGSKTTVADLGWLNAMGLSDLIRAARDGGTPVIGICGGYQMLGREILDPHQVESPERHTRGLGLLPVRTTFSTDKSTHQVRARVAGSAGLLRGCEGAEFSAYEIHMGHTTGAAQTSPFTILQRSGQSVDVRDGAVDSEGLTLGTYLHGLFHERALRSSILGHLARRKGVALEDPAHEFYQDAEYDRLAGLVREHIDMKMVYGAVGLA